jgi:non-canonical purine NTP pyrophosphatase (RdgB/HAM1 family)
MPLYFLTGSQGKLTEANAIIPEIEQLDIDLPEIQELDAHKIIKAKLQAAFEHQAGEFVVEDTSLYFDGLNGLPGPLVKWFIQAVGCEGLYKFAQSFGVQKCTAKAIIGYAKDADNIRYFEGTVAGQVVEPRGDGGFGFDPIFMPDGHNKTLAEMSREEKNQISARQAAFRQLKAHLKT